MYPSANGGFNQQGDKMQELSMQEIEMTAGATGAADVIVGAALGAAASGAGGAFGAGVAAGLGYGSFLGPAGSVIGAAIGGAIAYYAFM